MKIFRFSLFPALSLLVFSCSQGVSSSSRPLPDNPDFDSMDAEQLQSYVIGLPVDVSAKASLLSIFNKEAPLSRQIKMASVYSSSEKTIRFERVERVARDVKNGLLKSNDSFVASTEDSEIASEIVFVYDDSNHKAVIASNEESYELLSPFGLSLDNYYLDNVIQNLDSELYGCQKTKDGFVVGEKLTTQTSAGVKTITCNLFYFEQRNNCCVLSRHEVANSYNFESATNGIYRNMSTRVSATYDYQDVTLKMSTVSSTTYSSPYFSISSAKETPYLFAPLTPIGSLFDTAPTCDYATLVYGPTHLLYSSGIEVSPMKGAVPGNPGTIGLVDVNALEVAYDTYLYPFL